MTQGGLQPRLSRVWGRSGSILLSSVQIPYPTGQRCKKPSLKLISTKLFLVGRCPIRPVQDQSLPKG